MNPKLTSHHPLVQFKRMYEYDALVIGSEICCSWSSTETDINSSPLIEKNKLIMWKQVIIWLQHDHILCRISCMAHLLSTMTLNNFAWWQYHYGVGDAVGWKSKYSTCHQDLSWCNTTCAGNLATTYCLLISAPSNFSCCSEVGFLVVECHYCFWTFTGQ